MIVLNFLLLTLLCGNQAKADAGMPKEARVYTNGVSVTLLRFPEINSSEFTKLLYCERGAGTFERPAGRLKLQFGDISYEMENITVGTGSANCTWPSSGAILLGAKLNDPAIGRGASLGDYFHYYSTWTLKLHEYERDKLRFSREEHLVVAPTFY